MIIDPAHRIQSVETYYFARKLAQIAEMNRSGEPVINLGIGSPDLPPPPAVVSKLKEAAGQPAMHGYQSYKGIPELRKAMADWYRTHFKVQLNADGEILPLMGSKEGVMHIAMAFLNEGDQALIPNPGYPAYTATCKLAGAERLYYPLHAELGWKPDLKALAQQDLSKVKLMWLNYPNMPTGAVADKTFFEELVAFAHEHKILLCHDNPYTFILNDSPLSLLEVEGAKEVAIELTSLSKTYNMAGWRVGCMAAQKDYIQAVMKFKSNMDSGMFKAVQEAAVVALGLANEWMQEMDAIYRERREAAWKIMDLLNCQYDTQSAGLFVWAKVPGNVGTAEDHSEELLTHARVFITPGFIFGDRGNDYLRVSLCSEPAVFEAAYERLKAYLVK